MKWTTQALCNAKLRNDLVEIRRVGVDDKAAFAKIAYDQEIWEYFVSRIEDEGDLNSFVEQAIRDSLSGTRIVFSIIDRASGEIAGSSAYGNLSASDRRLEIGWSWLGRPYRGTGINKAAKALLLDYAFTELECERVEFKTDVLNERARRGLQSIGASEEGTFRSFNYMPSGRRRDAVYYSILKGEWPTIRDERFNGK